MRPYEVMLILDSGVEDAAIQASVDRIKDLVATKKGKLGQVEKWGRRRFAYELNHRWEGNYTVIELTADPTTIAELDRMLSLQDEVVRHKIVRLPESVAGRSRSAAKSDAAPVAAATTGEK